MSKDPDPQFLKALDKVFEDVNFGDDTPAYLLDYKRNCIWDLSDPEHVEELTRLRDINPKRPKE